MPGIPLYCSGRGHPAGIDWDLGTALGDGISFYGSAGGHPGIDRSPGTALGKNERAH